MSVCRAVCLRAGGGLWLVQLLVDKAPPRASLSTGWVGASSLLPQGPLFAHCVPQGVVREPFLQTGLWPGPPSS